MDIENEIKGKVRELEILWKLNEVQVEQLTNHFQQLAFMARVNAMDDCCKFECAVCVEHGEAVKPHKAKLWLHRITGGRYVPCCASAIRDERAKIY